MISEVIKKRYSVRTFKAEAIKAADKELIANAIEEANQMKGPLGHGALFTYIPIENNQTEKGQKIGTYGFIKHSQGYVLGMTPNNREALIDYGYVFEHLILRLTQQSIGTCWLGGTFKRELFNHEVSIPTGSFIPCITPVGYDDNKKRLSEKLLRTVIRANQRKPWEELFFNELFEQPLLQADDHPLHELLELVRLAPSASNKQPWRVVLTKQAFHFYLAEDRHYAGNKLGFRMQLIDIGIAMAHLNLGAQEYQVKGSWVTNDPYLSNNIELEYIISFVFE